MINIKRHCNSVLVIIALVAGTCVRPLVGQDPSFSRKELAERVKKARTAEDHKQLAEYFHAQERAFREKEKYQRDLLAEYLKAPQNSPSKYPTRGDSARHLASHYSLQAQKASDKAFEQEKLEKEAGRRKEK